MIFALLTLNQGENYFS